MNSNNDWKILIKFGTKQNLLSLQQGTLYMKNLKYFNELENSTGKADPYDGKLSMPGNFTVELSKPENDTSIPIGIAGRITFSLRYEKHPIFCMFSYDSRNYKGVMPKSINELSSILKFFSQEQRTKLKTEFGDYALIIFNTSEFIKRVIKELSQKGIKYEMHDVLYSNDQIESLKQIFEYPYKIAFYKDSIFSYQQEFRLFLTEKEVEDHEIVDIGNIKDITCLMSTDELFNL